MAAVARLGASLFAGLVLALAPVAGQAQGYPSTPELARTIAGLKQRAAAGDRDAAFELGLAYFNGRIVEFGKPQGIQWFEKAAAAGSGQAAHLLSLIYDGVDPIPRDKTKSEGWRRRAIELGDTHADWSSIRGALYQGPSEAQRKAFERLRDAGDHNEGQYTLATAYTNGEYGVAANPTLAYYWWLREARYDEAQALRYSVTRELVAQKNPAAVVAAKKMIVDELPRWRAGAEKDNPQALYELGAITFNGLGVPKDVAAGLALLGRSADRGYGPAAEYLGDIHYRGAGVPKDLVKAVYWAGAARDRNLYLNSSDLRSLLDREYEIERERAYFVPSAIQAASLQTPTVVVKQDAPTTPSAPVALEPRVALVIGNGAYGGALGRLDNPVNDARLMADALRKAGFKVELVIDADQRAMKDAIRRLGQSMIQAGPTATGLFYFAGHGAQTSGVNYLLPVGAPITSEGDLDLDAIAAPSVLAQMEKAGARTTILVLDACRNVPIQRASRDGTRGFARMEATGRGSYIAYSAGPGEVAEDGKGANSTFSAALAAEIGRKGQPIETTFRRVRSAVLDASKGQQTPWESSSLVADFKFTP